jgi:hypothetical protein
VRDGCTWDELVGVEDPSRVEGECASGVDADAGRNRLKELEDRVGEPFKDWM